MTIELSDVHIPDEFFITAHHFEDPQGKYGPQPLAIKKHLHGDIGATMAMKMSRTPNSILVTKIPAAGKIAQIGTQAGSFGAKAILYDIEHLTLGGPTSTINLRERISPAINMNYARYHIDGYQAPEVVAGCRDRAEIINPYHILLTGKPTTEVGHPNIPPIAGSSKQIWGIVMPACYLHQQLSLGYPENDEEFTELREAGLSMARSLLQEVGVGEDTLEKFLSENYDNS